MASFLFLPNLEVNKSFYLFYMINIFAINGCWFEMPSNFMECCGSGLDPDLGGKKAHKYFKVLVDLFWELKAFPLAWTSFMEA